MATRNKDALTPFKLDHLQGIFYIYLLSVIVSSFVLVTEIASGDVDTLRSVEHLGFDDARLSISLFGGGAPPVPLMGVPAAAGQTDWLLG